MPLVHEGAPLFPELMQRLDNASRHGALIILTDAKRGGIRKPYKRTYFAQVVRKIRNQAGLPEELTFESFRHGGITELGDAKISDQGALSLTGHKTRNILSIYMKKTETQRIAAAWARLDYRLAARTA